MEKLQLRDFLDYRYLSALTYAPDGRHAVFTVAMAREESNDYQRNLYLLDTESRQVKALTGRGDAAGGVWLDENRIMFAAARDETIRARQEKGEAVTCFQVLDIRGGEAVPFMTVPMAVGAIKPFGDEFIFTAVYDPKAPDFSAMSPAEKQAAYEAIAKEKDYEVIDEIPFWENNVGFVNKKRNRLYRYNPATGMAKPLTGELTQVAQFRILDQKVLYSACTYSDKMLLGTDFLAEYDAEKETTRILVPETSGLGIHYADYWQGEPVFFATDGKLHGMNQNPALYALRNGQPTVLWNKDEAPGNNVGTDCHLGGGTMLKIDGGYMYYTALDSVRTVLKKIAKDGTETILAAGDGSIDCFDIFENKLFMVAMRGLRLQELYALDQGEYTRLTDFNEKIFTDKTLSQPIPLDFESDGNLIQGFVMKPVNYDPSRRYPAIFDIHGGPKTAYGSVFFHEMQLWANEGYFVIITNPRGSDGRGDDFADIRGKYGTIDYDDLMRFVDEALRAYPAIDPERVGVTGGSYGGFMTNWIIGHTHRFKAAASQRSISNWVSKFNTTDIGYYFNADQISATPWENQEKLWWHSPIKYADQATTPTLFIHSEQDYRCWLAEGLQMFTALKYHGVPARLCMFRGENHELSRSGKPLHRQRRLTEITDWFNHYLK